MASNAGTIATAYVQIMPSTKGVGAELSKAMGSESDSAGKSAGEKTGKSMVSSIKRVIAAAGIGAAVVGTLKSALSEGGKLQQSYLGGVDTLYEGAADSVRKYADAAAKAGISANSYSEQAVSFGASLKKAFNGDVVKAAEAANTAIMDMADNSAKMGTDIGSIQMAYQGFAKSNYTMLDNLKLGYGGTKTEMERLLKDATALTGVKYDINNLGDVYSAIHAIQGNLNLTGVAAEEASSTFSGSFGAMAAAAQNFLGHLALGQGVGPALNDLLSATNTFLTKNLLPMIGTILSGLPDALSGIGSGLMDAFSEAFPKIASALPGLLSTVVDKASGFGQMMLFKIKDGFDMVLVNLPTWMNSIGAALPGLIEKVGQFILEGGAILLNVISDMISSLVANLPAILQSFYDMLPGIWAAIGDAIITWGPQLLDAVVNLVDALVNSLPDLCAALFTAIPWILENVMGALAPLGGMMVGWAKSALDSVAELFRSIWESIKGTVAGIFEGILQSASSAWESMKAAVGSAFSAIGQTISNIWNGIKTSISSVIDGIKNTVSNGFNAVKTTVSNVFTSIKTTITDLFGGARDAVRGIIEKIKGFFNFNWSWPKIPLPHISLSPSGWKITDIFKGSFPKLGIDWYAEGGIMTQPTIFDASGDALMAGGEAGAEAVLPISVLKDYMRDVLDERDEPIENRTINLYIDGIRYNTDEYIDESIDGFVRNMIRKAKMYG